MSETEEMLFRSVASEKEMPQPRLEDMPEFQKLVPEEQQRLLAMREGLVDDVIKPQVDILERTAGLGIVGAMKEAVLPT